MKRILSHIICMFSMALMGIGFSSCVFENHVLIDEPEEFNNTTFVLRLNTVNRYSTRADVESQEKIKTLRIIITDETDKVEVNRYFSDVSNRDFYTETQNEYIIQGVTEGKKNVFIFANEESVTEISAIVYSQNMNFGSLSEFFSNATVESSGFSGYVNTVNFSLNQNNISNTGLPYSSYYQVEVTNKKRNEFTCYLVPVCTKFRLNFYNYRDQAVTLNSVSLSSIADKTYLMAHVGDIDKALPGSNDKLYWIDWLHKISEISWEYDTPIGNGWFNNQYGWISDYSLPERTNHENKLNIVSNNVPLQPLSQYNNTPVSLGPFYLHESTALSYILSGTITYPTNLWWPFPTTDTKDFSENIEGLTYLFRNTFVDIDIVLTQNGNLTISYTVCPWIRKETDISFD